MLDPWPVFVEFRHASWVAEEHLDATHAFPRRPRPDFVAVDAPELPGAPDHAARSAPRRRLSATFGSTGATRARGTRRRRRRPIASTTSTSPTSSWSGRAHPRIAEETERTYVMFNNCKYDYAPRNAREMAEILGDLVEPRGGAETGEPAAEDADVGAADRDHRRTTARAPSTWTRCSDPSCGASRVFRAGQRVLLAAPESDEVHLGRCEEPHWGCHLAHAVGGQDPCAVLSTQPVR